MDTSHHSEPRALKAMLNVLGYDAGTHSGLISKFGLRMIKTNLLDRKFAEHLKKAFGMRESSDYELGITFGEEEVHTLIRNAEFLKKAQEFTEKNYESKLAPRQI